MDLNEGDFEMNQGTRTITTLPGLMNIDQSILNALAEPVLVLDETLRAVMANPAFYDTLKIAPGQLEGKSVQELIAVETGQPRLRSILETVVTYDRNVERVEIECIIPPRTPKILSVTARPILVADDSTEMVLVELRDVTLEKETERRIQELNERLRQHGAELEGINKELEWFTHSVSHDLRTPLRLMNKVAHLLLEDTAGQLPVGAAEKIHMILGSTQEMDKLIERLLAFSQVTREPMKKRRIDLRRVVNEALSELRDEHPGRDLKVTIDDLPPCRADRALMKQVLVNMLSNAIKFTRPRKRAEIRVGFAKNYGETVYFVRDNGVGFDASHAESMFLAFHRLHKALDFEGSGIGLALVKRIIDRHGGRIWAEGQIDQGATFYFTLGESTLEKLPASSRMTPV